jgi:hypothetical protein
LQFWAISNEVTFQIQMRFPYVDVVVELFLLLLLRFAMRALYALRAAAWIPLRAAFTFRTPRNRLLLPSMRLFVVHQSGAA